MEKVKAAYAAVTAWMDGNPRKAALAALGIGFVVGAVLL